MHSYHKTNLEKILNFSFSLKTPYEITGHVLHCLVTIFPKQEVCYKKNK